jgi:hypothetical protein
MPYSDHFETTPLDRAPRFLADQDGAFEVHRCWSRTGRCLEQVITEKPIPWGPLPDPFTLAGDVAFADYTVSADFHLTSGNATLLGRIDSADVFQDGKALLPSAYVFRVGADGSWSLLSAAFKKPTVVLAKGNVGLQGKAWHHFSLAMRGDEISATVDRKQIAQVHDASHSHGMFGLGSGWNKVQFDQLAVTAAK